MIFPHKFRTLNGEVGTDDGLPIPYEYIELERPELYHLANDAEEKDNIFDKHPDQVKRLESIAEEYRAALGDALTKREGIANREPGQVSESDD